MDYHKMLVDLNNEQKLNKVEEDVKLFNQLSLHCQKISCDSCMKVNKRCLIENLK